MILERSELKKHTGVDHYDGVLMHARWAYQILGKDKVLPIGNIIAFRSPMNVDTKFMVDVEDRIAKDFIKSNDAINFCWEIPDISAYAGVCFQRLFCTAVGNILGKYIPNAKIEIDGDDIFVHKEFIQGGVTQLRGKASVSISCIRNSAVLGHLGINILAGPSAPAFAFSTKLSDDDVHRFTVEVNNTFYEMTKDIFVATTKTI